MRRSRIFSGLDALIAYEDSQPVGFLSFMGAFDGAFGDCKGVYSPLHGGFFGGSRPERTTSALLDASLARAAARKSMNCPASPRWKTR